MSFELITAAFICTAPDGEDLVESLHDWFENHEIPMDFNRITLDQIPDPPNNVLNAV